MKITNKLNAPEPLYKLAVNSVRPINKETYSVTEILNSTKSILLNRRYYDVLEIDVSDLIPAMFGTGVHKLFEMNTENGQSELKLKLNNLTGICDLYHDDIVEDYKTTSVSKVIRKDFKEHLMQCIIYAYMIYMIYDKKVKKIRINYLMKDWTKIQSVTRTDYPQSPIYIYEYDLKDSDYDEAFTYINHKLKELKECENLPDGQLPECTDEEKWYTGDKYAVYKKEGDKRAVKVFETEQDAKDSGLGEFIEKRPGEYLKCNYYCNVKQYCKKGN